MQGDLEVVLRSLAADVDVDIKLDSVRLVFVVESYFHVNSGAQSSNLTVTLASHFEPPSQHLSTRINPHPLTSILTLLYQGSHIVSVKSMSSWVAND